MRGAAGGRGDGAGSGVLAVIAFFQPCRSCFGFRNQPQALTLNVGGVNADASASTAMPFGDDANAARLHPGVDGGSCHANMGGGFLNGYALLGFFHWGQYTIF